MNKTTQIKWPLWRILFVGLNVLAIILSLVLSWRYFKEGAMPGCGSGSSCDQVLSSRWSSIAGIIPVSGLALGAYLAMLVSSFNIEASNERSIRRLSWSVMLILAGTIACSAIWFTILQKWIIGEFCMYCMFTHITGLLLSALIIWRIRNERDTTNKENALIKSVRISGLFLSGMIVAGILADIQFDHTPAVTQQNNKQQIFNSNIDYQNAPIVGSPTAPHKVTLLFDYQCSHCQKIHFMLNNAIRQYEGKLAFVLCPVPLENSCNPYVSAGNNKFKNSCEIAKIGLAVWHARREVYPDFENWMFTYESGNTWHPRSLEDVKTKAVELVGKSKLEAALSAPWIDTYLHNSIKMFGQTLQNGSGAIPKMIYNNTWVIPEPYNADDLIRILQESLGVPVGK